MSSCHSYTAGVVNEAEVKCHLCKAPGMSVFPGDGLLCVSSGPGESRSLCTGLCRLPRVAWRPLQSSPGHWASAVQGCPRACREGTAQTGQSPSPFQMAFCARLLPPTVPKPQLPGGTSRAHWKDRCSLRTFQTVPGPHLLASVSRPCPTLMGDRKPAPCPGPAGHL